MSSVAQLPFVEGFLVRIGWRDIEPTRGVYDWSRLHDQLNLAQASGKKVALAVVQGSGSPTWLAAEGVPFISYPFAGQTLSVPAAWDPTYQTIWTETVLALGAEFGADPRISLVHVVSSSHNGFEMQLPLGQEANFIAAGYTEQGYIDAWKSSIDAYVAAFPFHPLDVEVHPVFGSDNVADQVTACGLQQLGADYGAFGAWWSVSNATQVYAGMFNILTTTAQVSFSGVQVVGSWVTTPERFNNDLQTYLDAYSLALTSGFHYAEIWNADLLDSGLQAHWPSLNTALHQ